MQGEFGFNAGVYNLLLLPAALLLFIWSTAANEFVLYLWDTFNYRTDFLWYVSNCAFIS